MSEKYGVIHVEPHLSGYRAFVKAHGNNNAGMVGEWSFIAQGGIGKTPEEAIGNLWIHYHEQVRLAIIVQRDLNWPEPYWAVVPYEPSKG